MIQWKPYNKVDIHKTAYKNNLTNYDIKGKGDLKAKLDSKTCITIIAIMINLVITVTFYKPQESYNHIYPETSS